MNVVERIEAEPAAPFDYAQMDGATADEARAVVGRHRARQKAYVIDTGRDLIAIKGRLEHGLFLKWIEAEMGFTARTAQNLMQAALQFGDKSEIVSHLPPSTLYQLASLSTPEPIRQEIVERLEAGTPTTPSFIASRVWEAKAQAKREAAEAKLTPDERKRQAKARRDAKARREREHDRWRKERDEVENRRRAATKELAEILAPRLDDDSYSEVYRLLGSCDPWRLREELSQAYGPTHKSKDLSAKLFSSGLADAAAVSSRTR